MPNDVRVIETSHVPQGGRITNNYVPADRAGCLLRCRSRIHEEMCRVQSVKFKRTLQQARERTAINPIEQDTLDQPNINTGMAVTAKRTH